MTDSSLAEVLVACDKAIARSARLSRVRDLVSDRFPEVPSLVQAARVASLSQSGLSRFFQREVGIGYSRWLRLLRLARAIELLRDTNRSVRAISRDAGFGCARSFRRACHAFFGLGPLSLRLLLRRSARPAPGGDRAEWAAARVNLVGQELSTLRQTVSGRDRA